MRTFAELAGKPQESQASFVQKSDARRDLHRFSYVVGDEYRGLAEVRSQPEEFALKVETSHRIERAKRFIEQENAGVGGERARDLPRAAAALRRVPGEIGRKSRSRED